MSSETPVGRSFDLVNGSDEVTVSVARPLTQEEVDRIAAAVAAVRPDVKVVVRTGTH